MKIIHANEPFKLSPSRQAQADALAALHAHMREPNLAIQVQAARQPITIGDVVTYWSIPVVAGLPPYVTTMSGGARRLLIASADKSDFAIYDGGGDLWRCCVVTRRPEIILASLPRRALLPPPPNAEATSRQLATMRKLLDMPPDKELPRLHAAVVSRVIERFVVERSLPALVADFNQWLEDREATLDEHAA